MGFGGFRIRAPAKAGNTVSPGIENSTGQAEEKPLKRRFSQREGEQNVLPASLGKHIISGLSAFIRIQNAGFKIQDGI